MSALRHFAVFSAYKPWVQLQCSVTNTILPCIRFVRFVQLILGEPLRTGCEGEVAEIYVIFS